MWKVFYYWLVAMLGDVLCYRIANMAEFRTNYGENIWVNGLIVSKAH